MPERVEQIGPGGLVEVFRTDVPWTRREIQQHVVRLVLLERAQAWISVTPPRTEIAAFERQLSPDN